MSNARSKALMTESQDRKALRRQAMDLLSRREYLYSELAVKLQKRIADPELIAEVLTALARENLQSDQRYCDSYVRQRSARGYGPERIRLELCHKGAQAGQVDTAMQAAGHDWYELARRARVKKFGPAMPADFREKSKQLRFLQYRGFGGDYAHAAFADE